MVMSSNFSSRAFPGRLIACSVTPREDCVLNSQELPKFHLLDHAEELYLLIRHLEVPKARVEEAKATKKE
jgi:hypothetical protein